MPNPDEYGLEIAKAAAGAVGKESVNKFSSVIGSFFPFWGLKKKAVDTYVREIEESNLTPEAKMIAISNAKQTYKQLSNQFSIAQIAQSAAKPGTDFSKFSLVDDEWLERFMDSAKFVSDEKVQLIWGNILAKEFETPNSTPPSIIRILSEITPKYAKVFEVICSLAVDITFTNENGDAVESIHQIILPHDYDYLNQYDVCLSTLNELESLGLIQFEAMMGLAMAYELSEAPKFNMKYGSSFTSAATYIDKKFPIGGVRLTDAGAVIAGFVNEQVIPSHFDEVKKYMESEGVKFLNPIKIPEHN